MQQKIAFPSLTPGGLSAIFSPRFGRCDAFTLVVQENGKIIEVIIEENGAKNAMGGAGVNATQIVANMDATDILVGRLGPNAYGALSKTGIKVHMIDQTPSSNINIKQALEFFNQGKISPASSANVASHSGMSGGGGGGRGRGQGRMR